MRFYRHVALLLMLGLGMLFTARVMAAVTLIPSDLSGVRVMPNPWRSDRHAGPVRFDPITTRATVKLFTVSGRWIRTLSSNGPSIEWDLTNANGQRVASGIYLFVMTTDDGAKKTGQIIVIH